MVAPGAKQVCVHVRAVFVSRSLAHANQSKYRPGPASWQSGHRHSVLVQEVSGHLVGHCAPGMAADIGQGTVMVVDMQRFWNGQQKAPTGHCDESRQVSHIPRLLSGAAVHVGSGAIVVVQPGVRVVVLVVAAGRVVAPGSVVAVTADPAQSRHPAATTLLSDVHVMSPVGTTATGPLVPL